MLGTLDVYDIYVRYLQIIQRRSGLPMLRFYKSYNSSIAYL